MGREGKKSRRIKCPRKEEEEEEGEGGHYGMGTFGKTIRETTIEQGGGTFKRREPILPETSFLILFGSPLPKNPTTIQDRPLTFLHLAKNIQTIPSPSPHHIPLRERSIPEYPFMTVPQSIPSLPPLV